MTAPEIAIRIAEAQLWRCVVRFRRAVAAVARLTAPGYGFCKHCGMPWKYTEGHNVTYRPGRAAFFVCETCWPTLSYHLMRRYARQLVYGLGRGWRWNQPWDDEPAEALLNAFAQQVWPS